MTNDDLKVLNAAVKAGSFKGASKQLFITQSAVSKAIKRLESEIGFPLFSRESYRPILTEPGKAFYNKSKEVLAKLNELSLLSEYLEKGVEAELRIVFSPNCPSSILEILKKCEEESPHTELHLNTEYLDGVIERLLDGEADLAILPWRKEFLGVESQVIGTIQMSTVAAPNFPPLQQPLPLEIETLRKYPQVILKGTSRNAPSVDMGILENSRHWTVSDAFTKKHIILSGLGWGRLPNPLIETELNEGRLIPLTIKNYQSHHEDELRIARRINQPVGPVAEKLWNMFLEFSQE